MHKRGAMASKRKDPPEGTPPRPDKKVASVIGSRSVVCVPPGHYIHVRDIETGIERVVVGPSAHDLKANTEVSLDATELHELADGQFCIIEDPVDRDFSNTADSTKYPDGYTPNKLGHRRTVKGPVAPFALFPGESFEQEPRDAYHIDENGSIKVEALDAFVDEGGIKREVGDMWLIMGECTYIPPSEVGVVDSDWCVLLHPGQTLTSSAGRTFIDQDGIKRCAEEIWTVEAPGLFYIPHAYETAKTDEECVSSGRMYRVLKARPLPGEDVTAASYRVVKNGARTYIRYGETVCFDGEQRDLIPVAPLESLVVATNLEMMHDGELVPAGGRFLVKGPAEFACLPFQEIVEKRKKIDVNPGSKVYVADTATGEISLLPGDGLVLGLTQVLCERGLEGWKYCTSSRSNGSRKSYEAPFLDVNEGEVMCVRHTDGRELVRGPTRYHFPYYSSPMFSAGGYIVSTSTWIATHSIECHVVCSDGVPVGLGFKPTFSLSVDVTDDAAVLAVFDAGTSADTTKSIVCSMISKVAEKIDSVRLVSNPSIVCDKLFKDAPDGCIVDSASRVTLRAIEFDVHSEFTKLSYAHEKLAKARMEVELAEIAYKKKELEAAEANLSAKRGIEFVEGLIKVLGRDAVVALASKTNHDERVELLKALPAGSSLFSENIFEALAKLHGQPS